MSFNTFLGKVEIECWRNSTHFLANYERQLTSTSHFQATRF